jgi:alpha-tubulin suppressor-like RCC1 family protein
VSLNTFNFKLSAWFKTKLFSLYLFSLILFSVLLIGCGSSGGGGSSSSSKSSNNTMTGFTFNNSVIHIASIDQDARKVDITINNNFGSKAPIPIVTHTGIDYSPKDTPIDFSKLPQIYKITAEDDSNKTYQVIVRRAIDVFDENELSGAINDIASQNLTYITLLIKNDINLPKEGGYKRVIPSDWKERNIILEKDNSSVSNVTIKGLAIEGNDTVRLIDVNIHITKIVSIAAGVNYSFALDSDGQLWASGYNWYGQLGLGNTIDQNSFKPVAISGLAPTAKIVSIAAGEQHSLAVTSDGKLLVSGYNEYGQLGLGDNISQTSFQQVASLSNKNITEIAASGAQSFAIDSEGKLWASGYNGAGQLGLGDNISQTSFQQVTSLSNRNITKISAGISHTLALDSEGKLLVAGYGYNGQLGLGNTTEESLFQPVTISDLAPTAKIVSISAGFLHSLVLDSEGGLWATGGNIQGALGLNDTNDRSLFERVTFYESSTVLKAIVAGQFDSLALDINGSVWAAGEGHYGQLGGANVDGFISQEYFDKAPELSGIEKIAGSLHSLALDSEGKLWASGYNEDGQLGLGDNENRKVFTLVPSPWL